MMLRKDKIDSLDWEKNAVMVRVKKQKSCYLIIHSEKHNIIKTNNLRNSKLILINYPININHLDLL
jgi:hypothetical protein